MSDDKAIAVFFVLIGLMIAAMCSVEMMRIVYGSEAERIKAEAVARGYARFEQRSIGDQPTFEWVEKQ